MTSFTYRRLYTCYYKVRCVFLFDCENDMKSLQPAAARSRSRSNIAQEGEAEASSQESLQELMPEEVLVISIGSGPQTVPGMMSENEVMHATGINGFACRGDDGVINSPAHFLPSLKRSGPP